MSKPMAIAAIWVPVVLSGWPDFTRPAWWVAVATCVGFSAVMAFWNRTADPRRTLDRAVCEAAFHRNIDAVTVLREGRFIYANDEAVKAIGLSSMEGYLAAEPSKFAPELQPDGSKSADKARAMMAEAMAKGHARGEWVRRHADGRLIPVELTLIPIELEGKPCVLSFYHDISERVRMREARETLLRDLTGRLDALVVHVTQEMKAASDALAADAHALATDMHDGTAELERAAAGSASASQNVTTIAAATEELAGTIAQILAQVRGREAVTRSAIAESEAVSETISRLAQSGERIGDVAGMIAGIATQTNMLALNATIEAARAGDAGRSFAVVANEVKNLATRTAQATGEVQEQVGKMQSVMTDAIGAIRRIGATIRTLTDMADEIGRAVAEQGSATKEIASSIAHASNGATEAAASIGAVVTMTRRSEGIAEQVKHRAGALDNEIARLHAEVEHFRTAVGHT